MGEIEGMGDEFAPPEQPRCFWGSRGLPLEGGAFVAFSLLWLEGQRLSVCLIWNFTLSSLDILSGFPFFCFGS